MVIMTFYSESWNMYKKYLDGLGVDEFDGHGDTELLGKTLHSTIQVISVTGRHK